MSPTFDPLLSNYWVLARIVCNSLPDQFMFAIKFLRSDQRSKMFCSYDTHWHMINRYYICTMTKLYMYFKINCTIIVYTVVVPLFTSGVTSVGSEVLGLRNARARLFVSESRLTRDESRRRVLWGEWTVVFRFCLYVNKM